MKRLVLLLTLLFSVTFATTAQQTVTVTFNVTDDAGQPYSDYMLIKVKNLTRGWEVNMPANDNVLVLNNMFGIEEHETQDVSLGTAYPNPFNDKAYVPLHLSKSGDVILKVFLSDGTMVAERNLHLNAGSHRVNISLSTSGMAFLAVITPQGRSVAKLVSMGHGGQNAVGVETVSTETPNADRGSGRYIVPEEFAPGDWMQYKAWDYIDGELAETVYVTQQQFSDETVTLRFILNPPTGAFGSMFSVGLDKQVFFSQGNLRYRTHVDRFEFAEEQYEYVGDENLSNEEQHRIDLLGWGTSGYQHGAVAWHPTDFSTNNNDYQVYGDPSYNLYDQNGKADWGYHPVWNGGNMENMWRTLTYEEWNYLLNERDTRNGLRYAKATLYFSDTEEVQGLLILPDGYSYTDIHNANQSDASYNSNWLSPVEWHFKQRAGVVFLPAAGWRVGSASVQSEGAVGVYHSSSRSGEEKSVKVYFNNSSLNTDYPRNRPLGCAVRLVRDINTSLTVPVVQTISITNVGMVSADCNYAVVDNGGSVMARGVCWNTNGYPTLGFDNYTDDGTGWGGNYVSTMTGLLPNTTYYVRAYATNSVGTAYGEVLTFTTSGAPTGGLGGLFSINNNEDKVFFSKGNLQYKASTNTWRFAEHQYDYIGGANTHIASTYSDWIDLFGWGTSGYDHGAVCYQPWSTSQTASDYYAYGNYGYNLGAQTGKADWGYNAISNGGNTENQWRTLTNDEWEYVFCYRNTPSGILYAVGTVDGKCGVILLPDNWDESYYSLNIPNLYYASYNSNVFNASQWSTMEEHGAVFLPAAGVRIGTNVDHTYINENGMYWTSQIDVNDSSRAKIRQFYNGFVGTGSYTSYRYFGCSVRLVCPVQ